MEPIALLRESGPDRDRRRAAAVVAVGALVAGGAPWLDNGSPGGLTLGDPALAVLGSVLTGVGLVALAVLALGWRPGTGRTAWATVGVAALGLVAVELAVVRAGIAERFLLPAAVLPVLVVAALVGQSRPTPADAARHGMLAAGVAAVVLLVPLGYALTVGRSGVPLTGAVGIAGVLLPPAFCLAGAVGGGLGGAVASRRRGRASRA